MVQRCNGATSRSNRWLNLSLTNLIATGQPRRESTARKTSPIAPAPSRASILYGPTSVPGAGVIVWAYSFERGRGEFPLEFRREAVVTRR